MRVARLSRATIDSSAALNESNESHWPDRGVASLTISEAAIRAGEVRVRTRTRLTVAVNVEQLIVSLGWLFQVDELGADLDRQDALLIPCRQHRFAVVVDPRLSAREAWMIEGCRPEEAEAVLAATGRFRAGHELGHTLFFDRRTPPRRVRPHTPEEESFCDSFSRFLLLPDSMAIPDVPAELAVLARVYGLSLEIVAAALAERRGDVMALGGVLVGGIAHVRFTAGVPPAPPEASFRWPGDSAPLGPLSNLGLYWPRDYPSIHHERGWSDGHRFLVVAQIERHSIESVA